MDQSKLPITKERNFELGESPQLINTSVACASAQVPTGYQTNFSFQNKNL
jgi:hypothetical protein